MLTINKKLGAVLCLFAMSLLCRPVIAQDAKPVKPSSYTKAQLYELLSKKLNNVKFVGNFTILGKDSPDGLPKEEYTIVSATKQDNGDFWLIKARIKYGSTDVEVPMVLEVKWAETTPVISLTNVAIPGLGTFSSRVVIYKNKYAGTWSHGDVGGHLFGTIEKNEPAKDDEKKDSSEDK